MKFGPLSADGSEDADIKLFFGAFTFSGVLYKYARRPFAHVFFSRVVLYFRWEVYKGLPRCGNEYFR